MSVVVSTSPSPDALFVTLEVALLALVLVVFAALTYRVWLSRNPGFQVSGGRGERPKTARTKRGSIHA
jgi:hypothetical protein